MRVGHGTRVQLKKGVGVAGEGVKAAGNKWGQHSG